MAGEWIPYDLALPTKPEVQELIDLVGEPVEVVVYRMLQLWGWASLNSDDGTVRSTPARLARTCGGDERFWLAVEAVGWLVFNEDGSIEIPGWGRRFSQSAKARALHLDRAERSREGKKPAAQERSKSAAPACAPASRKRTREEEKTVSSSSSPTDVSGEGETLRAAWNAAARNHPAKIKPFAGDVLPEDTLARLAEPGWLEEAMQAIERLPACRYFTTPVNLGQFSGLKAGRRFTRRVLEQQFDNPRTAPAAPGGRFAAADPPPAAGFSGAALDAFEYTRAIHEAAANLGAR